MARFRHGPFRHCPTELECLRLSGNVAERGGAVSVRPYLDGSQLGALLKELGFANPWTKIPGMEGDPAYGLGTTDVEGLTKLPADTLFWYIGNEPFQNRTGVRSMR